MLENYVEFGPGDLEKALKQRDGKSNENMWAYYQNLYIDFIYYYFSFPTFSTLGWLLSDTFLALSALI